MEKETPGTSSYEVAMVKYNQRFQTTEVKDAINQTYTFNYDPLGRLLGQTRAGGTMAFEYRQRRQPQKAWFRQLLG